jgi:thioredoxin reductase (NADPH)
MSNSEHNQTAYDLIIIGAGPAGLTAGIYANRYRIRNFIISTSIGGLINDAHKVCNYPSVPRIDGRELAEKMERHLKEEGGSVVQDTVKEIKKEDGFYKIITTQDKEYLTRTILLATGTKRRRLEIPNEDKFLGRGVSYCATCDAMFFQNKNVAVVGGSDAANTAALLLTETSRKVYQIYRGDKLRGEPAWIEKIKRNPKIELVYDTNVIGLKGNEKLQAAKLDNPYQGNKELEIEGLFIEIGSEPENNLTKELELETDDYGYIQVSLDQATSKEGIYAAGDITTASNKFRQVITACAEGATATNSIYKYLQAN